LTSNSVDRFNDSPKTSYEIGSTLATNEISQMLAKIRGSSVLVQKSIEESSREVEKGSDYIHTVQDVLHTMAQTSTAGPNVTE